MATFITQSGDTTGKTLVDLEKVVGMGIIDNNYIEYYDGDGDLTTPKTKRKVDSSKIIFSLIDGSIKEWDYKTPHTGAYEVQSITLATPAENDVYKLTFGDVTIETAALGAAPDEDAVTAAILASTGYSDLPFNVTAGTNAITLTWKEYELVSTKATLIKTVGDGTPATTTTTTGVPQTTHAQAKVAVAAIVSAAEATTIVA